MISSKMSKKKLPIWQYKKHQLSQLDLTQQFQLYLLANPSQLKNQYMEEVPYLWSHHKIGKQRQFQIYLNELNNNQLDVKGFPYVDNMLLYIDEKLNSNFKIICQANDLEPILKYHNDNKKLISIHIFDQTLTNSKSLSPLLKNKKIEIKSSQFKQFKRLLYRKNYEKNQTQTFMNATRITNWDIAEVNQSRLVLKTLLVSKNDEKGKQDFIKLANNVESQLGKVAEYQMQYKLQTTPQQAIKWYTKQSFYHRLINNTLKAGKGNPLMLSYIRFPVKQLYNAIKNIYNSRQLHTQSFQCYRGGRINQKQLQYFRKNVKGFIEMQGFLSCSKNKKQMEEFIVNCVFKIKVNNLQRDKKWDHGFCILDDKQLTFYVKEEEVLFNIFCVMEIKSVTKQFINNNEVDVIQLEYGSLASLLYQKKHNLTLKDRQYSEKCINNYLALKPYYESITNQVDCFRFFGKFKQVQLYYLTLLKHLQKNKQPKDTIKYLNAYYNLGQNYLSLQSFIQAKQNLLKAKDIAQKLSQSQNQFQSEELLLSRIYNGLGIANKNLNKLIQAKENYLNTIKLIEKSRNKNQKIHLATAYNNLALILMEQFQQEAAFEYFQKAFNLLEGEENQTIANIHYNIGQYYLNKSSFKQSIRSLIKSLEIYNKLFGTHKDTINCHFKLGEAYLKNGSLECNRHFSTAMDMMKNLPFHSQSDYIKLKRDIEELRNNHNKQKRSVSSVQGYQGEDIFSFLGKNKQEINRYLSKDKIVSNKSAMVTDFECQIRSQGNLGLPLQGLLASKNTFNNQTSSTNKFQPSKISTYKSSHNSIGNKDILNSLETKLFSVEGNTATPPLVGKMKIGNNLSTIGMQENNKNELNQGDKLRQLRAKNVLDTQIPTIYESVHLKTFMNNNNSSSNYRYNDNNSSIQPNDGNKISPFLNHKKADNESNYQDAIDKKMASYDQNEFINSLKLGTRKKNLIFG